MHHRPALFHLFTAFTISLAASTVQADTRLTYTDTGLGEPPERKTLIQIHGDKVRMEEVGSGIYSLYDSGQQKLYTVNTKTRQYIETTPEKIRARIEKMSTMQEQMKTMLKQQIAQMPEEQRKLAEQRMQETEQQMAAMKSAKPPHIEITQTDRKETVQGMECTISTASSDGKAMRDICNAPLDAIDGNDHKMLVGMFEYMDNISRESAKAQGINAPDAGSASLHKNGLALRIQALPEGPRSELSSLENKPLNDDDFTLPADFKEFEPSDAPVAPPAAAGGTPAPAVQPPATTPGN